MKSDLDALEVNAYPFLVLVGYAASAQRNAQSGMIDRFQKARPESPVNGDGGLDDPRGKRLEFMAQGSSSGSITKTRKYESTKKSRTGTLPCLGCQRPAANAAFWEWTRWAWIELDLIAALACARVAGPTGRPRHPTVFPPATEAPETIDLTGGLKCNSLPFSASRVPP